MKEQVTAVSDSVQSRDSRVQPVRYLLLALSLSLYVHMLYPCSMFRVRAPTCMVMCVHFIKSNSDPSPHIQFCALVSLVFWIHVNERRCLKQSQLLVMSVLGRLAHFCSHSAFTPELSPKVTLQGLQSHLFCISLCSQCRVLFRLSVRWLRLMTFEVASTHSDEDRGR